MMMESATEGGRRLKMTVRGMKEEGSKQFGDHVADIICTITLTACHVRSALFSAPFPPFFIRLLLQMIMRKERDRGEREGGGD